MKVCIFGAGAIGGHLAVRFDKGGAETSVIARGAQLEAIRSRGLTVRLGESETTSRPGATDDPSDLGPQDVVVVTVKAPALPDVARTIGPLLGPTSAVVFAMNGIPWWYFYRHGGPLDGRRLPEVDSDNRLWSEIGPERAIGGIVYSACEVVEPGVIALGHDKSRLIVGEPDGSRSGRVEVIADLLRAGGLPTTVTEAIRDEVWTKLMNNVASGPLAILTQCPVRDFATEPVCEAALRMMLNEAATVAEALGCQPSRDIDAKIAYMQKLAHKPSILQDLERARPMEIAAIYGTTLTLARMAKVETPMLDLMVTLATLRARAAGLLPSLSGERMPR